MDKHALVTVVTPTYNRCGHLKRLYESLENQNSKNFIWLIVDDGSVDKTKSVVDEFKQDASFSIEYIYKANGGKHTALNLAIDYVNTELFFIVDSDDIVTSDSIQTICNDWNSYRSKKLCGISYLRGYDKAHPIGDAFPKNYLIDSFTNVRVRHHVMGDKAEVWATRYLKQFRFPIFKGERFLVESWMWLQVSDLADMLFVNKVIYITEYLQCGLTQSGRKLRIKNPRGGMTFNLLLMDKKYPMKDRIKSALLYTCYSFFSCQPLRKTLNNGNLALTVVCLLPGYILYRYWKSKYLGDVRV